ncbi:MAG: hypothetical protein KGL43_14120 [Burkholderiales bacterium]|nr:hypothetical protein [Burkholderiales bacterium]MDE2397925.1 hypothetical protein [Burkholderiales bacterium]MDE2454724.1 hypothetical protein [Burkholderiales bacterium]
MRGRLLLQRLVALFVAGLALFDFPLLSLWQGSALGLFAAWALVIVLVALLMERARDDDDEAD